MKSNNDNIELRSENVKNIIGQVPPIIIRYGISIILIIILGLILGLHFIKYEYSIKTNAIVREQNDSTIVKIMIPFNEKTRIKNGDKLLVYLDSNDGLYDEKVELLLQTDSGILNVSQNKLYFMLILVLPDNIKTNNGNSFEISDSIELKAEILTNKKSILNRLVENFEVLNNP